MFGPYSYPHPSLGDIAQISSDLALFGRDHALGKADESDAFMGKHLLRPDAFTDFTTIQGRMAGGLALPPLANFLAVASPNHYNA